QQGRTGRGSLDGTPRAQGGDMRNLIFSLLAMGCGGPGINPESADMTAPPDLLPAPDLATPTVHIDLKKLLPTGSNAPGYVMGGDPGTTYMGGPTVHIKSKAADTTGFGALIAT